MTGGDRSVAEYAIEYRAIEYATLAVENGWNDESLFAVFSNGLNDLLKDELISYPESSGLDELIYLAMRIDNRCREHQRERCHAGGYERSQAPRSFDSVSCAPSNPAPVSRDGSRRESSLGQGQTKVFWILMLLNTWASPLCLWRTP